MATYGIDFGNSNSYVAVLKDNGYAEVISNLCEGSRLFPSCVLLEADGTVTTGKEAAECSMMLPEAQYLCRMKRELAASEERIYSFDGGASWTATELTAKLFETMKEAVEDAGGSFPLKVGLAIPPTSDTNMKMRLLTAARQSGFEVVSLVSDPLAAVYADIYTEEPREETVLVFDLGEASLELAVVDVKIGRDKFGIPTPAARIVTVGGDEWLGAADWDEQLYAYILEYIEEEYGICSEDAAHLSGAQIRSKAEYLKKSLSSADFKQVRIQLGDMPIRVRITKTEFEQMTQHLVDRAVAYVDVLLDGLGEGKIDRVFMLGGGSRIPAVRNALEQRFPGKVQLKDLWLKAKGAAMVAAFAD